MRGGIDNGEIPLEHAHANLRSGKRGIIPAIQSRHAQYHHALAVGNRLAVQNGVNRVGRPRPIHRFRNGRAAQPVSADGRGDERVRPRFEYDAEKLELLAFPVFAEEVWRPTCVSGTPCPSIARSSRRPRRCRRPREWQRPAMPRPAREKRTMPRDRAWRCTFRARDPNTFPEAPRTANRTRAIRSS